MVLQVDSDVHALLAERLPDCAAAVTFLAPPRLLNKPPPKFKILFVSPLRCKSLYRLH